ncbi:MAG TPA: hypothetical protein DEA55_00805 [Rhodospirillaceae bacterium]|nr:hypothetical protein [Rhodospirillaceae bacterium]
MANNSTPENPTPHEPKIIWDFDPRNLPPKFLQAVGLLAGASAQTEHVLGKFIGGLLGIDAIQALALTSNMTIPLKERVIRALAELRAPDLQELDKIDDLIDAAIAAFEKRNTVLHNPFMIHPETEEIFSHRLRVKGSLHLELKVITIEEIEQDAITLYEIGMRIMEFIDSRGLFPPIPIKPLRKAPNRGKEAREKRRNPTTGNS